ncbi:MAG: DUF2341 domain-containing protein [Candidatus Woesearchaeota archaeon]
MNYKNKILIFIVMVFLISVSHFTSAVPIITNAYPANNSIDIQLNPTITANISDSESKSLNWTIQTFDGSIWTTINSGTDSDGSLSLSIPTNTLNKYNTSYQWKINLASSGTVPQIESTYYFVSRLEKYYPKINTTPADKDTAVKINATLYTYIDEVYRDNKTFNVTISILNGSTWKTVRTLTNIPNATITTPGTGYFTEPLTTYYWKVNAVDSAGMATEQILNFTTGGALTPKWSISFDNTGDIQIMPVMGDIDNDGTQEIVFSAGGKVLSVNGKTGQVEWTVSGSTTLGSVELADVNNDGIPEVLYSTPARNVVALKGDGTTLWSSVSLKGDGQPMFPLLAYDIDGDGYPTIYFAAEDQYPSPYSGNFSEYTGALSMLDHNGNLLADTWLFHPCWGGLSLADPNFDGNFILYVSDRRSGYNGMTMANGLQAYDAKTLEMVWNRGDILHSSSLPVLADVTKDGALDVVAQWVTHRGVGVLNATTGETYPGMDYFNRNLPTHGAGTVYDIDKDGNLEIINAVDSDAGYPKDFVVFDLVEGKEDFHPYFDNFWVAWPPEAGNVIGDGDMEILAATGTQGFKQGNFPLLVYDSKFNLIDRVDMTSTTGQLTPARVFDIDGDGLNEVVVAGLGGRLMTYDTKVPTANPAPRTWTQRYSEYRTGAAEYVELPGPKAPTIRDASPADNSENTLLNPILSIKTYDYQKDTMNIRFEINDGNGWKTIKQYNEVANGIYTANTTGYAVEYGTKYYWRVTATDIKGNINQQTYSFNTAEAKPWPMPGWVYRKAITIDKTKVSGELTGFPVLIELTDPSIIGKTQSDADDILFTSQDGETIIPYEIEKYNPATGHLTAWVKTDVSNSMDTIIFMYYGNVAASSNANPESVWDSEYLSVHHLEEIGTTLYDSTANNNDGIAQNGVSQNVDGKIDGADMFDGVDDKIQMPQVFTSETQFTIEGWMNTANKQGYVITQRNTAGSGSLIQYYPPEGNFQFFINANSIKKTASANSWHHVVATFDGTTSRLFIDGTAPASGTASAPIWPAQALYLGNRDTSDRGFQGMLDEIRISRVARSQEYITTSYNNQNSPATFISIGREETPPTKPMVFGMNPYNGQIEVATTLSQLSFDLFDGQNNPMTYTVATSPNIGSGSGTVTNGRYSISVSNLKNTTEYTWYLNVTDGTEWSHRTFTFTTKLDCVNNDKDSDGYSTLGSVCGPIDCNDANKNISPGTKEICGNSIDEDCSGIADACLIADSTFEGSTDSDDLRLNSPVQDWYESRGAFPTGADPTLLTLDTTNVGGNSGKKALLKNNINVTTNAYLAQEFGSQQVEPFNVSFDIYIDSIDGTSTRYNRTGTVYVGDDGILTNAPMGASTERYVVLSFYDPTPGDSGNDLRLIAQSPTASNTNSNAWINVTFDLSYDTWYNIKVDIDPDNRTYDVYVNDELKKSDIPRYSESVKLKYISFVADSDARGAFYIDNVKGSEYNDVTPTCIDVDGDGYGIGCILGIDCNDFNNAIRPGATETCDTVDNDCDGSIDEGVTYTFYQDLDYDGYGNSTVSTQACTAPINYSASSTDCNDNNSDVNPGVTETCDSLDNDCDGSIDEGNVCAQPTETICTDGIDNDLDSNIDCADSDCSADSACNVIVCGDGNIEGTETCDDGDTSSNDGCSSTCNIEAGWTCLGEPSSCTEDCVAQTEVCDGADNDCDNIVDEGCSSDWPMPGWEYRKQITIDHTQVTGTLNNFPVLIDTTEINAAKTDGSDILFTAEDGTTKLSHEIETYNAGHVTAWVKTNVNPTTDTIIYIYYNNPTATSQENPEGVWSADYLAIQHLEETSGTTYDSTQNNNDGTPLNAVTQNTAGKIDGGDRFDGVDDKIQLPQVFTTQTQFTIEAWINTENKQGYIISQRDGSSNGAFMQYVNTTPTQGEFQLYINSRFIKIPTINGWHYVVGTYDGTTARLYVDAKTPTTGTATLTWPNLNTLIGDRTAGARAFKGTLDEIRISNTARTQEYITTTYNNHNNPQAFAVVGLEESSAIQSVCGNGIIEDVEECDDNNIESNDGCSLTCNIEEGYTCVGEPSVCNADSASWPFPSWNYRKQITVNHTQVAGDQNDFPVLIDLTDTSIGANAQTSGNDIFFADSDGITKLDFELESYSAGHVVAWVKTDISSTTDKSIYIYYDNPTATSQENPEGVWNADYLAVQHLEEITGITYDSTQNNNDGTPLNAVTQNTAGKIDGGDRFDGVDDKIQLPQVFTTQTQFTIEAWINTENKQGYIISQRDGLGNGVFMQYFPTESNIQMYINSRTLKIPTTTNTWHYVVGTYDGTTARLYMNGGTPVIGSATITWPSLETIIGDRSAGARAFQGTLDEIRISNTARTQEYITTTYNNQNSPNTFTTIGTEETA